ncbi:hypothetical protein BDV95DRAFT_613119 [Massariosphaeria phaeospora]|uniref:Uncharacterized protein n=1 Tax=Massariosphaeria phaeospora TaxID=100035 RepID=A0A7C8HYI6_9PLEO|nr:hypothetical protein BDV95DRAFT_613119 [Massariosphaeria phaeospora]
MAYYYHSQHIRSKKTTYPPYVNYEYDGKPVAPRYHAHQATYYDDDDRGDVYDYSEDGYDTRCLAVKKRRARSPERLFTRNTGAYSSHDYEPSDQTDNLTYPSVHPVTKRYLRDSKAGHSATSHAHTLRLMSVHSQTASIIGERVLNAADRIWPSCAKYWQILPVAGGKLRAGLWLDELTQDWNDVAVMSHDLRFPDSAMEDLVLEIEREGGRALKTWGRDS